MDKIFILHIVSWVLAAICDAAMDKLAFHYEKSVFRRKGHETIDHKYFWDPKISWRNKYKGRVPSKGPKFPGSTTIFVGITDGFHLMQLLMNLFIIVTIITGIYISHNFTFTWSVTSIIIIYAVYKAIYSLTFELFFSRLFKR